VPLRVERGRVPGLGQYLGGRDLIVPKPAEDERPLDRTHAVTGRVSPGDDGGSARRARGLGVHAREHDALVAHAVKVRRLEASDRGKRRDADVAEGGVVPHDVDDVGRCAVLLAKLRKA
jgi:hypothetical protein